MLLDKLKLSLRITHDLLDEEILDIVAACKQDLKIAGVKNIDEEEPMIGHAIKLYVKKYFEQDTKKIELYENAYAAVKNSIALCGDYNKYDIWVGKIVDRITDEENVNEK